jgi:hypothetical protein
MAKPDPSRRANVDAEVAYWKDEIDTYERMFDKFLRRGRKVYKKYKDVRSPREDAVTRYNILWANTQTRMPALYARNPKVVVERRFRDKDPVGRVGSEILERSIQYTIEHENDAWQVNRQCILDYELPGRGTVWIRYEPHFKKQELAAATDEKRGIADTDPEGAGDAAPSPGGGETAQPLAAGAGTDEVNPDELKAQGIQTSNVEESLVDEETLDHEVTKLDYVYWEDYGHSWARVDDEVRGKWRRVYMDREELEERFLKSKGNPRGLSESDILQIPLDWAPKNLTDSKVPVVRKKAIVYEIWDKRRKRVLWLVKNFPRLLDRREDPLGLKDFFPCPRPLMANLCNDDMVPTPNFSFYQDQANEVDELSTRIVSITKALKVAGVRDTSAEGLDRLLSEGVENQLVPVDGWAALKEKGGLAGVFELLPMKDIAETLGSIREQRKELIEDIYQLTGIADIVRGMSDPEETATAQQLKGQFSMIRMEDSQQEVQRFCRDEIVIIGQIVAGYDIETLKAISGVKLLTAAEKQQIQMQLAAQARMQQMQAAQAQQPGPAPSPIPTSLQPALPGAPPAAGGMPHPGLPGAAPSGSAVGAGPQAPPQPGGQMSPAAPSMPMTPAPGQAPPSPEKLKLMELPTWEEVAALLENPILREFRLDIETDSTIKMDEEAEKKSRIELITAVTGYMTEMVTAGMQAPEILPMLGELLMFGIRAFKSARAVEQTFDDMMQALEKAAKQPKGPDPKIVEIQTKAQTEQQVAAQRGQVDAQIAQVKAQSDAHVAQAQGQMDMQLEQHKAQLAAQTAQHQATTKAQMDHTIEQLRQGFEQWKTQFETAAKERIAVIDGNNRLEIERMKQSHEKDLREGDRKHEQSITRMNHSHEEKTAKDKSEREKKAA